MLVNLVLPVLVMPMTYSTFWPGLTVMSCVNSSLVPAFLTLLTILKSGFLAGGGGDVTVAVSQFLPTWLVLDC